MKSYLVSVHKDAAVAVLQKAGNVQKKQVKPLKCNF